MFQSSNSLVGFKTNLHVVEIVEMFLCSPKKTGEGMGQVAVSSSIATDQLGCLRGGIFHSSQVDNDVKRHYSYYIVASLC